MAHGIAVTLIALIEVISDSLSQIYLYSRI